MSAAPARDIRCIKGAMGQGPAGIGSQPRSSRSREVSIMEVESSRLTVTVAEAARLLGIGRNQAYRGCRVEANFPLSELASACSCLWRRLSGCSIPRGRCCHDARPAHHQYHVSGSPQIGSSGTACCPVHADRTLSLKIVDDERRRDGIDVHCFARCVSHDVQAPCGPSPLARRRSRRG